MSKNALSSLVSRLPSADTFFTDYYPSPGALGAQQFDAFDPYWGAIATMQLDDEVSSSLELRHAAALTLPWFMDGAPDDIDFAERVLAGLPIERMLEDMLHATELGFNPLEIDWAVVDGLLCPTVIERRNPRLFRIDINGQLYYAPRASINFQPVQPGKVMLVRRGATRERPYGVSALESVWPIWQTKWSHIAQLERLGQKYSVPSVIALADANNDGELGDISATLAGIESGEGVALSGVKELIQLTASGKATELLSVIQHYDNKICKRITGQTLASSAQQYGSRALGEVHERAALRISSGDLKMALYTLNITLLRWIFILNNRPGAVRVAFDEKAFEALFKQATNSGVELSNSQDHLLCL